MDERRGENFPRTGGRGHGIGNPNIGLTQANGGEARSSRGHGGASNGRGNPTVTFPHCVYCEDLEQRYHIARRPNANGQAGAHSMSECPRIVAVCGRCGCQGHFPHECPGLEEWRSRRSYWERMAKGHEEARPGRTFFHRDGPDDNTDHEPGPNFEAAR
jgi:hypothetical protein